MSEMAAFAIMIRKCSISEIMEDPAFPALIEEYAAESAVEGMPSPNAKMESYAIMELTGMLHPFGAFKDGELVGFISVLTPMLPHYGRLVASAESFFVTKLHRKGGAGLRLLKAVEQVAIEEGSPGIFVSAPIKGMLIEILPRRGYTECSRIFFKRATWAN